jgi:hypothetical protein
MDPKKKRKKERKKVMKFVFFFQSVWQCRQKCPQIGFKMGHLSMCTSGFSDFFLFAKFRTFVNMKILLSRTNSRKCHYGILELVHFKWILLANIFLSLEKQKHYQSLVAALHALNWKLSSCFTFNAIPC